LKAVVNTFGHSEYALRLLAQISGLTSVFLMVVLARRFLTPLAVPIAVGQFAFANFVIFHAAQTKQYSVDIMFAIIIYLVADSLRMRKPSWWLTLLYALTGVVALCLSHPAVFVLAGVALSYLYFDMFKGDRRRHLAVIGVWVIWGACFLYLFSLTMNSLTHHQWLLNFWKDEFMPLPPTSMMDVQWYVVAFFQMFTKMLGYSLKGIGGLVFLLGCYALYKLNRPRLAALLLPFFLTLVASALHKYPFGSRLILFLAPAVILLMAEGAALVLTTTRSRPVIGVTLLVLMFLHPVMWDGYYVVHPRYESEIKPCMAYLQQHRRPGDVIYVYYRAEPAFTFYAPRYGLDFPACCTVGVDSRYDWNGYEKDLGRLAGNKRVWIIFAHIYNWVNVDDEDLFLHFLNNLGTQVDSLHSSGSVLYLYDLSEPPADKQQDR
jgi:hypothetical protein